MTRRRFEGFQEKKWFDLEFSAFGAIFTNKQLNNTHIHMNTYDHRDRERNSFISFVSLWLLSRLVLYLWSFKLRWHCSFIVEWLEMPWNKFTILQRFLDHFKSQSHLNAKLNECGQWDKQKRHLNWMGNPMRKFIEINMKNGICLWNWQPIQVNLKRKIRFCLILCSNDTVKISREFYHITEHSNPHELYHFGKTTPPMRWKWL